MQDGFTVILVGRRRTLGSAYITFDNVRVPGENPLREGSLDILVMSGMLRESFSKNCGSDTARDAVQVFGGREQII